MKPPRNRRASRRHKSKRSTKAVCLKGTLGLGRNIAMSVLDVSETGARLTVGASLEPGQEVEVSLEGACVQRPVKRVAKVLWCVAAGDGAYAVGVQFEKLLDFANWQSLTTSE
jgi:hypothetical protein